MSLINSFDKTQHFDELNDPLFTNSGVKTPAARKALAQQNLGVSAAVAGQATGNFIGVTPIVSNTTDSNQTYTGAQVVGGAIQRSGITANRTDTMPTAALLVAATPGAVVGSSFYFFVRNADDASTVLVNAGAGGAMANTNAALAAGAVGLYRVVITNVLASSEAYLVFRII